MNEEKLATIATRILVEHIGVSAQFVVADALAMSRQSSGRGADVEELQLRSFLINLGGLLPPTLPYDGIRESILKQYRSR